MSNDSSPNRQKPATEKRRARFKIRESAVPVASDILGVLEKKVQRRAHSKNRFTLAGYEEESLKNLDTTNLKPKYGSIENGGWPAAYARCINIFGGSTTIKERGWILYDVADSPITFAQNIYTMMLTLYLPRTTWFNVSIYVLVQFIATIKASLTFFFYLTFSSSAEYGSLKTTFLWYSAHIGGITIFMSFFIFSPNWAILLLIFLDVFHKVCYRVCSVAYDALLFPVTNGEPARQHMIQSVAVIVGYLVMAVFALFFILIPVGISYLLHGEIHIGTHDPTLSEDVFLNIMFLQFKLPLMFLGIWWIVFTRQSFFLMGDIPYGLPYPKGLKVAFSCCSGKRRKGEASKARDKEMELAESANRGARLSSDTSDVSEDVEVVRISDVDEIGISNNYTTNTKELADKHLYGDYQAGKKSGSDSPNDDDAVQVSSLSQTQLQSVKAELQARQEGQMTTNSISSGAVDLTLQKYSKCQVLKFAFLQGLVEIGRTFVTLKEENMHDLYKFLICSCFITDATSMITTVLVVIVTKTWDWSITWMGIAGCVSVVCAVATLMTVRKLIKSKRLKTFNAMRIFAICMLISLIWLALLEMPPVPYVEGSGADSAINATTAGADSAASKPKRVSWSKDRVGAHIHTIFVLTIFLTSMIVFNAFLKSSICSLTPEHLQSSVFAIAEMTQKGTSILGPAITLAILQGVDEVYHEKVTIGVAAFMVCLGIPFFMFVDEKRGNECAEKIDKMHLKQLQREASIALGLSMKNLRDYSNAADVGVNNTDEEAPTPDMKEENAAAETI